MTVKFDPPDAPSEKVATGVDQAPVGDAVLPVKGDSKVFWLDHTGLTLPTGMSTDHPAGGVKVKVAKL